MRVHILQHVSYEGIGSIQGWLRRQEAAVSWTRFHAGELLPNRTEMDLLIVMGGPMSVNDEAAFPWLAAEKRFVGRSLDTGCAVLGICLGAQLLASVAKARVYPGRAREIGWFPVHSAPGASGPLSAVVPDTSMVFHWHGETFDLPSGATNLMESEACAHQAFSLSEHVLGLQFHLEMTLPGIEALAENCAVDLVPGPFIQPRASLLAGAVHCERANRLMDAVLDKLVPHPRA